MKIEIIIGILIKLLQNKKVRGLDFASEYNISIRTVYRYIKFLQINEVPIVTKRGPFGGIEISNTFKLDRIYFTDKEKTQLFNAINSINDNNIKNSILNKIKLF